MTQSRRGVHSSHQWLAIDLSRGFNRLTRTQSSCWLHPLARGLRLGAEIEPIHIKLATRDASKIEKEIKMDEKMGARNSNPGHHAERRRNPSTPFLFFFLRRSGVSPRTIRHNSLAVVCCRRLTFHHTLSVNPLLYLRRCRPLQFSTSCHSLSRSLRFKVHCYMSTYHCEV